MNLREFLSAKNIEPNLLKLLAETIPLAIVRTREVIEGADRSHAGGENVHGEKQLALDVQANEIFCETFRNSGLVASFASEEMEEFIVVDEKRSFTVVFDPLDGSSLVDVNFSVGSIFGIYKGGNPVGKKGSEQLAAGFVVYGPRTTWILAPSPSLGVHEFFMNHDGTFSLIKENLRISDKAKYFAPGNLRAGKEREDYRKLLEYWVKSGYTLRYSGGMVPDINHIFLKGNGIFTYPGYSEAPEGKLRLLYECAPMAFLMEEAGGMATDGKISLLEKPIENLHQRTPIFIGSREEVLRAEKILGG